MTLSHINLALRLLAAACFLLKLAAVAVQPDLTVLGLLFFALSFIIPYPY